ncbi:hypothetical protein ACWKTZ_21025 [Bacillus cereus]|uniref:hypothetical protein n=1 Tax=Bacillus cereus TaxID=1396 RepID=UPI00307AAAD7
MSMSIAIQHIKEEYATVYEENKLAFLFYEEDGKEYLEYGELVKSIGEETADLIYDDVTEKMYQKIQERRKEK